MLFDRHVFTACHHEGSPHPALEDVKRDCRRQRHRVAAPGREACHGFSRLETVQKALCGLPYSRRYYSHGSTGWNIFVCCFTGKVVQRLIEWLSSNMRLLQIIAQKLRGSAIEAFWSGTSFLLCSTIFQPNFASFSHIFGRKPMIYTGLVFFMVGVIVAAVANNFTTLLVGRSIQGIGGGGLIALTEIVVTDLVPMRFRGQWFGIISGMWAIGSVSGPVIGGALSQNASWVRILRRLSKLW